VWWETDQEIYEKLVAHHTENSFLTDRVEMMIRESARLRLGSRAHHVAFLGAYFRVMLMLPKDLTDEEVRDRMCDVK
jgi:hypothetical protein